MNRRPFSSFSPLVLVLVLALPTVLSAKDEYEWIASATPERTVETGMEVAGIVEKVLVDEGVRVEKGEIILRLRADREELAVEEARIELSRENSRRDHLEAKAARMETMVAENLVSREEFEDARIQAKLAVAGARMAAVRLSLAETERERRVLRAPWDGHVLRVSATEGGIVKAFEPLAEIADAAWLKATFFLDPTAASGADWPDRLRLFAAGESGADAQIAFAVDTVDPFPDPSTERIRLVLRIDPATGVDPGDRLRLVLPHTP